MNDIRTFDNQTFGAVRVVDRDGEPWFVAADVCKALEINNPSQALTRLDADERFTTLISNEGAASGKSEAAFVNEPGLYSLVLGSRKPEAKAFKRWITHEVIPAIRKHGVYAVDALLNNPDAMITALTAYKEEREKRKALEAAIEQDKPFTGFGKAIAANSDAIPIGDFAKLACNSGINIGRTRMFRWLREHGYLQRDNMPYQRHIDSGLFAVREYSITTIKGDMLQRTPLVTGKGQMVLLEKPTNA